MPNNTTRFSKYAALPLRGVIAVYLYLALKAAVYKPEVINEFGKSLAKMGLPAPQVLAYIGTYGMLLSYVLLLIGWKARWAAVPMIIYFFVAVVWGHVIPGHGLPKMTAAISLLALGVFFLLHGAGKPSVDEGL